MIKHTEEFKQEAVWTCTGFAPVTVSLCHFGFECERADAAQI